jgi:hypothetical protein
LADLPNLTLLLLLLPCFLLHVESVALLDELLAVPLAGLPVLLLVELVFVVLLQQSCDMLSGFAQRKYVGILGIVEDLARRVFVSFYKCLWR